MNRAGYESVLAAVRQYGPHLDQYASLGDVKATAHPNGELLIFNYTPQAAFTRRWCPAERVCRGLIVHWPTATIRARPFPKFFNLTEMPETDPANLPDEPMEVTEKADGSLGIAYHDGSDWAIATRGSFTSEQALWATAHLRDHYDPARIPNDVTLLFEILYPANRIVVDYGSREDLVLIGAMDADGTDYRYPSLAHFAARLGCPVTPMVAAESLDALAALAARTKGEEGWVVRWAGGFRAKIKTAEYVRLHKILTHTSARTIWEWLKDGRDVMPLVDQVPGEFAAWVHQTAAALTLQYRAIEQPAQALAAVAATLPTRKDQAAFLAQTQHPAVSFRILDHKSYADQIWRMLRPAATRPFRTDDEG